MNVGINTSSPALVNALSPPWNMTHDHLSSTISVATVTIIAASGSLRETLYLSSIFYFLMVSNVHLMVWFLIFYVKMFSSLK